MDFDQEIGKHLQWRTMVEGLFGDTERASYVSPSILIQDDKCHLGQWIYSDESRPFESHPSYKKLIHIHKEFHLKAGTILAICNNGNCESAAEFKDEFYSLSGEVIKCLEQLKQADL